MSHKLLAEITGSVWKIEAVAGARVEAGDVIMIIESMKMEVPVETPVAGICRLAVAEHQMVQEGDVLAHIE